VFTSFRGSQRTDEGSSSGVSFEMSGAVAGAFGKAKGTEDFSKETLARRMYGDAADAIVEAERSSNEPVKSSSGSSRGERSGGSGRANRNNNGGNRPAAKPVDVPPALSDDDIAKMDRAAATKAWSERKKIAAQPGVDAAAKDRLKSEVDKLRARMDATRKPSGESAGGGS
ncbi:MAG TPA: hypothetical protein VG797_07465, partial [Phycisphaerales bacterium]|nr:hypothetical protein [Phycisphaerales bacterium]